MTRREDHRCGSGDCHFCEDCGPDDSSKISERGPWTAEDTDKVIAVRSGDFTHDVILIVTGDFATRADKLRYAQRLADVLSREFQFTEE